MDDVGEMTRGVIESAELVGRSVGDAAGEVARLRGRGRDGPAKGCMVEERRRGQRQMKSESIQSP